MSSSSGNGGQNVNRVATKACLFFSINDSLLLDDNQKKLIKEKLKNRINKSDYLLIVNQETRSALKNKRAALKQLLNVLEHALKVDKVRKKSAIPASIQAKRLKQKRQQSQKKQMRKKVAL
jgi:ribosome-associated protein